MLAFKYDNNNGWPGRADGKGALLRSSILLLTLANPENWRSEFGAQGNTWFLRRRLGCSILINEILAHTDVPVLDTIELYNPTDQIVDISHWYLTDSR